MARSGTGRHGVGPAANDLPPLRVWPRSVIRPRELSGRFPQRVSHAETYTAPAAVRKPKRRLPSTSPLLWAAPDANWEASEIIPNEVRKLQFPLPQDS